MFKQFGGQTRMPTPINQARSRSRVNSRGLIGFVLTGFVLTGYKLTGYILTSVLGATLLTGCDRGPVSGQPFVPVVSFGEVGSQPGQFANPRGLDILKALPATADQLALPEELWIVDKLARIQRIDPETGASLGGFRTLKWDIGRPTGITAWRSTNLIYDPALNDPALNNPALNNFDAKASPRGARTLLFVPDTHYHRVLVYDAEQAVAANNAGTVSPEPILQFGSFGTDAGQFVYPTDVAILTDDAGAIRRLYVSEYGGNDRISIYEPTQIEATATAAKSPATLMNGFTFVRTFGRFGDGSEHEASKIEFNRAQAVVVDAARERLVVADACNHRIGVFTLEGQLVRWIGEYEPGGDAAAVANGDLAAANQAANSNQSDDSSKAGSRVRLRYPYGVTVRGDGTAMVSEFGASRIHWIDLETGLSLGTFGVRGSKPGEVIAPWAVGFSQSGSRVLVLDSGNNRVQGFELGNTPRRRIATNFVPQIVVPQGSTPDPSNSPAQPSTPPQPDSGKAGATP